jgi:hypothetical protein
MGPGGQVEAALERFPDDPRLLLARTSARAWPLTRLTFAPSFLEFARADAMRRGTLNERGTSDRGGIRDLSARLLTLTDRAPALQREYETLSVDPALRGEIELYVGFLDIVTARWSSGLQHLLRVPDFTQETFLNYLSHYLTGLACLYSGDRTGAISGFRRALSLVPNARSASTQLAVEFLQSADPSEHRQAYALLLAAYGDGAPDDPWRLFGHGDARLWETHMASLRAALR